MPPKVRTVLFRLLLVLGGIFAIIQVVQVDRTNPPVLSALQAPAEVEPILRQACYDCHSHETRWPWYGYVAPLSWWLVDHVEEGRGDLNFSDWPALDFELQELAFHDIEEQLTKDTMPLRSYRIMHSAARLTDEERETLLRWARSDGILAD